MNWGCPKELWPLLLHSGKSVSIPYSRQQWVCLQQLVDARLHHLLSEPHASRCAQWTVQWSDVSSIMGSAARRLIAELMGPASKLSATPCEMWLLSSRLNTLTLLTAGTLQLLRAKQDLPEGSGTGGQLRSYDEAVGTAAVALFYVTKLVVCRETPTPRPQLQACMEALTTGCAALQSLTAKAAGGGPSEISGPVGFPTGR